MIGFLKGIDTELLFGGIMDFVLREGSSFIICETARTSGEPISHSIDRFEFRRLSEKLREVCGGQWNLPRLAWIVHVDVAVTALRTDSYHSRSDHTRQSDLLLTHQRQVLSSPVMSSQRTRLPKALR